MHERERERTVQGWRGSEAEPGRGGPCSSFWTRGSKWRGRPGFSGGRRPEPGDAVLAEDSGGLWRPRCLSPSLIPPAAELERVPGECAWWKDPAHLCSRWAPGEGGSPARSQALSRDRGRHVPHAPYGPRRLGPPRSPWFSESPPGGLLLAGDDRQRQRTRSPFPEASSSSRAQNLPV